MRSVFISYSKQYFFSLFGIRTYLHTVILIISFINHNVNIVSEMERNAG
jgi:hypothetical protein